MTRATWMYFQEGLTQQQTADRLGLSRIKVARLISAARKKGIVRITIDSSLAPYLELEQKLREVYGLVEAIVTTEAPEGEALHRILAQAGANLLSRRMHPGITVGIGHGRTLSWIPTFFHPPACPGCTFITLVGMTGGDVRRDIPLRSYSLCQDLADEAGGRAEFILAPAAVSNGEIKESLLRDTAIGQSLKLARHCQLAVIGVGPAADQGLFFKAGYMNQRDLKEIEASCAVGEALGSFFNERGQEIPTGFSSRLIAISLAEFREIPTTVIVAGGARKIPAIRGALVGRLAKILVTDAATARGLVAT